MQGRYWLAALALTLAAGCARQPALPDGTRVIDETLALARGAASDSASRSFTVGNDSILIARADERLTDVRLAISASDAQGKLLAATQVENHLGGAGIELAALAVPEGARVIITLTGAPDMQQPGSVPLRVQLYSASAQSAPAHSAWISAALAWTQATQSSARPDSFKKSGLSGIDRALEQFSSVGGDAAMAAQSRLVRANLLQYFKTDARAARAEAQRAAQAFAALPQPDALGVARANYIEALALMQLASESDAVDPAPAQARLLAQTLLDALSAPGAALAPIERARMIAARGQLDFSLMRPEEATRRFEAARQIYAAQGHVTGERNMRFTRPLLLVEIGRFADGALAFDPLLPELDLITDPELRTNAYLAAARAQSLSGRADEGLVLVLKGLELARDHQLTSQQATALDKLGYIYEYRGDFQQAIAFYQEAVKITATQKDTSEHAFALRFASAVARNSGNLELACKLAADSVRFSVTPISMARNHLELAACYRAKGNIPAAIAEYRAGLAVDLGNPRHHAHTDGKMLLAGALLELPHPSARERAEAVSLLAEALDICVEVKDGFREIQVRRAQAEYAAQRGDRQAALAGFDRVLTLAEAYRARSASADVRASMLNDEEYAFRGLLDIVLAGVARRPAGELRPASAGELAALLRLERARQRSFGALRVGALDAPTSAKVDALLQKMATTSLRIATLVEQDHDATQAAALQSLQLDMSRLHAELDTVRWAAANRNAQSAAAAEHHGWRPLAPGAVQLSYAFGDQHVYALVRSRSGTRVTMLAPPRRQLEEQLADLAQLDARHASGEIEAALENVSGLLLPPGILPVDSSSVAIVAEGRIASVPFPALRSPTDARRRLIETHDVAMVTTLLGVDEAPRAKGSRPFRFVALASGNGTYRSAMELNPIPTLNAAKKEIATAAAMFAARDPAARMKLFTGADGSAAALRDIWASGADVVHFATHALADLTQPVASLLVLPATDASGRATYLTAGQVQAWRGDTELVFLSACESAIGPPQYAAGMPGLQRAFLRAGARGVIATLAPIEDVLAQQFAADFYARYTTGMSAARALGETQRAWLAPLPGSSAADQLRRRITALSHAYFAG